jgi:hypothetical protein
MKIITGKYQAEINNVCFPNYGGVHQRSMDS